ncbi:mCG147055 [Mus musculus]|nr:mCG147055 [Mus musculus]
MFFVCIRVRMSLCTPCTWRYLRRPEGVQSPRLRLQAIVSCHVGTGNQLQFPARTVL